MSLKKHALLTAFIINAAVFAALVLLLLPYYYTNDDVAILILVNGTKSVSDPHLVYQNTILGYIYKTLYNINHSVPWYALLQYLILFISFTGATWVIIKHFNGFEGIILSILLVLVFGYEAYIKIQYSKTAGIAAAAGMLLLLSAVRNKYFDLKAGILGFILALFGSLYRFQQFLPCAALMTGIGLYLIIDQKWSDRKEVFKRLMLLFAPFVITAIVCFGGYAFDRWSYHSDPLWDHYLEYNEKRTELLDYGFPDYEANRELYEKNGITPTTYSMFTSWNFADPEYFNVDIMDELIQAKPEKHVSKQDLKDFVKQFPSNFFALPAFWIFLLFIVLYFLGKIEAKSFVVMIYEALLFGSLYLYLFWNGRYFMSWIDTGLIWSMCLVVIWLIRPGKVSRKLFLPIVCVFMVVFFLHFHEYPYRWKALLAVNAVQSKARGYMKDIASDKEHLYVMKMGALSVYDSYGPFDEMPEDVLGNVLYLGGWSCESHAYHDTMEKWSVSNPFKDLIDNDNLYLLDNSIDMTLQYLHEHYAPNAEAVHIRDLGRFSVYQIKS